MLGSQYEREVCSVARALEIVGERWTLLIVRDAFLGVRRFEDFQQDLGIARNVLSSRLERLVEAGILEKVPYRERPLRHEYRLTERGLGLWPVITSLMLWGDEHFPTPEGPPTLVEHRGCGGHLSSHGRCDRCGEALSVREAVARPGPGAPPEHPLLRR